MYSVVLDDFDTLSGWTTVASGQAQLHLSPDQGLHGKAMRLDFDFQGGGGFVVARKRVAFSLPETYAFSFYIRGAAPANKFEFKLIDPSGHNVWWFHRDAFTFPADWQPVRISSSQIEFAWGPLGGGTIHQVGALELVIAAGPGGQGTIWIDTLRFEDTTPRLPPVIRASSAQPGHAPECALTQSSHTSWRCASSDAPQWLQLDFQEEREYGGLIVQWDPTTRVQEFDVQTSHDGSAWHTVYAAHQASGDRSYIYLPGSRSRYLRLLLPTHTAARGCGIVHIDIKPADFSRSINAFFQHIARTEPRGLYPKYLYGEQTYWTLIGSPVEPTTQALMNEEGMVEVDKGSFSVEPFLYVDGTLLTWADVQVTQELAHGYLPLPSSYWRSNEVTLQTTACATGEAKNTRLYIRYRLENTAESPRQGSFFVALRPFQVTPPWQAYQGRGGVSMIRELAYAPGTVRVNNSKIIIPLTPPDGFGAAAFEQGAITDYLKTGTLPSHTQVSDAFGYASGALRYALDLAPYATQEIYLAILFGAPEAARSEGIHLATGARCGAQQFENAVRAWETTLAPLDIQLPAAASDFVSTCKTAAAHILLNRDGAALQPGPRRYTRSWIRDGATMAAALLRIGCADVVRDYLRWYAGYQAESGHIPCCVDQSGADWLPEYDSQGEFIYAIMEYFRFTGEQAFLAAMWPAVVKAVDYLESLRQQRLTPPYDTPAKRACYGLLPESVSHEGYLAHPVHAYWDDFWALRGLKDAAAMAQVVGDVAQAERMAALRDAFRETLQASIRLTMHERQLAYIPASVELADFDPTATAVALTQVDEASLFPPAALDTTFGRYLSGFRARQTAQSDWANYTPYEIRLIGALIRLGKRQSAYELAAFFLSDQRPQPWNQWPEIAWRDPTAPGHLGDLPHSWVGAEYMLAFLSMLAFEREADQTLVLAAGIPAAWITEGIAVRELPTHYGKLSYTLRQAADGRLYVSISGDLAVPPGKIVVKPPLPAPLIQVEVNGEHIHTFDAESVVIDRCPVEIHMKMAEPEERPVAGNNLSLPG
jgi:hypothetical protein